MRKCLAILFLLIFSLQVIPLKAIGKFLNSGQNTEEVQDDADCNTGGKEAKYSDDNIVLHFSPDMVASRIGFNMKIAAFINKAESLPSVHVAELLSPPPDVAQYL